MDNTTSTALPARSAEACHANVNAVRDALYVLNGKWKLPLIVSLLNGPRRFKEIQRALVDITPKVLSKELRELEINGLIERQVFNTVPVTVTYQLSPYSDSLHPVIESLMLWGQKHRERIVQERRSEPVAMEID
ncbi:winged helix-turn-helix transcriptional regulator [Mucilaginibacter paludis]|uniref:Transcriptional regulator, HxlR family n=1 Tax=Mucilaginibacter paludis DSM 18603 TaxID=714943 RepID=H1YH66_9SPHI|nr:helix-turn-helix domain-containing protein [Mucilaginibacter paludis]EHQ24568.1 transcriptional regulator, HxlR family [Mucilaginibacter paludis DSM 18603]